MSDLIPIQLPPETGKPNLLPSDPKNSSDSAVSQFFTNDSGFITRLSALCVLIGLILYALVFVNRNDTLDLQIYLNSAERLREGRSLYEMRYSFPERAANFELQYLYPPALAGLLALLGLVIPQATLTMLWQAGLVAATLFSAILLSHLIRKTPFKTANAPTSLALFIGLALWPPTLDGILWGQATGYILVLLVYATYCATLRRDTAAGIALGVATALKVTPIFLLIPLFLQRRLRAVVAAICTAFFAHLSLLIFPRGVQSIPEFIKTTGEIASGQVVDDPFYEYSIRRVLSLFFGTPAITISGLMLLVILIYLVLTVRQNRQLKAPTNSIDALCALQMLNAIPIMLLASPLIWFHHLIWLFPVLVTIRTLGQSPTVRRTAIGLYLLLAPLLYLHVAIRNLTGYSDGYIKSLPVLVIGLSYLLLHLTISQTATAFPEGERKAENR